MRQEQSEKQKISEPKRRFKMKTKTDNTSKRFPNINLRTETKFILRLQGLEERIIFFLQFLSIEQSIFYSFNSSSSKNWSKITDYGPTRVSLTFVLTMEIFIISLKEIMQYCFKIQGLCQDKLQSYMLHRKYTNRTTVYKIHI